MWIHWETLLVIRGFACNKHLKRIKADHLICLQCCWCNRWLNSPVNHQTDVCFGPWLNETRSVLEWQCRAGANFLRCLSSARACLPTGSTDSRRWRTGSTASPNPSWVSSLHCTMLPYHWWFPNLSKLRVRVIFVIPVTLLKWLFQPLLNCFG